MTRVASHAHVDRWAKASLLCPVLSLVLVVVGGLAERTVWSGSFTVGEDDPSTTPELTLPDSWIGAVRIEARAAVPEEHWAAYQVTALAPDGTVLLELVKEAWSESGTWYEDGESGTWSESDLELQWDVRARQAEPVRFELSLLDQGSAQDQSPSPAMDGGAPTAVPIAFTVRAGVVDGRFLALAFLLSLAFSLVAYYLAGHGGVPVIVETNLDSEVKGRADMGGPGKLVAVAIAGLVDETAPPTMRVKLILRDDAGATRHSETEAVAVKFRKDEGEVEDGRFSLHRYFELPKAGSWGVFVEVSPDQPMEKLKLVVRDRATTRGAVDVLRLPETEGTS